MAQVDCKIRERAPTRTPPRTKVEQRQQSVILEDEYDQLDSVHLICVFLS